MATMREVAALAGVSAKTVSRVFNEDPHVSPSTRVRVEAALRELNYVPNSLATNFRTGRALAVGIAVPSLADPFFAAIVAAVDAEAKHHDLSTVVTSIGDLAGEEEAIVESLLRRQLSGLILAPISSDQRYLERWLPTVPTVFVDRAPSGISVDSFTADDFQGAALATSHLIEHGHERIAFFGDDLAIKTTANRLNGYRDALQKAGIEFDQRLVGSDVTNVERAEDVFAQVLPHGPSAVFSSNARVSIALMPALKRSGLPIVGFDDFSMADLLTPSITVIDQDPESLGLRAAQRLFERMAHPNRRLRKQNVLPVRLIERESCRIGAGARRSDRR